jgi:membrane-associated protease RseP (regulator of RpoE activity)
VSRRELAIHAGLFLATCATTYLAGGAAFSATLMTILVCHEGGHYWLGRRHGVPVSLPYFIPLPPMFSLGTLGAVIRMDEPIADRKKLFDVGVAGPLGGMAVALPLLVVGLSLSEVGPPGADSVIEGNSILYALLKYAVFGRWLPGNGVDVQLHPMALAAWVGLLITMINLLPIGQLDGGHVARAALGQSHETWSRRLHVALPAIGLVTSGVMFAMARDAGRDVVGAMRYASYGASPWLVWSLMLALMKQRAGEYHPPVGDDPLDPRRRALAIGVLVLFALIATPVPFRPVL